MTDSTDLAALVASRICHDLANPLGAVGNGVELLSMTQTASPEMELVAGALAGATARLDFMRLAFGAAQDTQRLSAAQVTRIIAPLNTDNRHQIGWHLNEAPRPRVKQMFLAILCLETALPLGGSIDVSEHEITGAGRRVTCDPALWAPLTEGYSHGPLTGAQAQFAALGADLRAAGIVPQLNAQDTRIALTL